MTWLVGVDLGGRSAGALELAPWILRTAKMPMQIVALNVNTLQLAQPAKALIP
jgi:hypothetical protein